MLIYILYFIVIAVLAVEYEHSHYRRWPVLLILILMLGLMAGLKGPYVARDYASYKYGFDAVYGYLEQIKRGEVLTFLEPGFVLVVAAIRSFSEVNYTVYCMLFFAFASLSLKVFSIEKLSINPFLVVLLYFSHYFALHEMTQIRIGFASAIFFVALWQYVNGSRLNFVLLVGLASLFHYSALLYFLVLGFNYKNLNRYVYGGILLLSIVLAFVKLPLFEMIGGVNPELITGKLKGYENLQKHRVNARINVFNAVYIINVLCIGYFLLLVPHHLLQKSKQLLFVIKCNILSIFLLSLLAGTPLIAFRFSELFGVTSIFMFAGITYYLPFKRLNVLVPVITAGLFFYINYFYGDLIHEYYFTNFR